MVDKVHNTIESERYTPMSELCDVASGAAQVVLSSYVAGYNNSICLQSSVHDLDLQGVYNEVP
jgi:hypothetical protein